MSSQILNLTGAYDPLDVKLYIGGLRVYGFAPDTKIAMSRNGDNVTTVVGVDGEISAALNRDRTGTMTVSLQQTSGFNDTLSAFQRQADSTGLVWLPILLEGSQGPSVTGFCNIQAQPEFSYGSEIGQLDWTFFVSDLWYAPSAAAGLAGAVGSFTTAF